MFELEAERKRRDIDKGCHCAINADGSDELPYDADCPVHEEKK